MIRKVCICTTFLLLVVTSLLLAATWYGYRVKIQGELELKNAHGVVTITREPDTMIAHIRG